MNDFNQCKDCKYYQPSWTGRNGGTYGKCIKGKGKMDKNNFRNSTTAACLRFTKT